MTQPMSILFVSGTMTGGSARSTHELARGLSQRGHVIATLSRRRGATRRDYIYKRSINLATKVGWDGVPGRTIAAAASAIGGGVRGPDDRGYEAWTCVHVESALPRLLRRQRWDVVVASSLERVSWRIVRATLERAGIPSMLYLREAVALGHLEISSAPPDQLLTNAVSHGEGARRLGFEAKFIPSVTDVSAARAETSRERVLLVNPLPSHGVEVALAMAQARPAIPFALQESWAWVDHGELATRVRTLPNVQLRPLRPTPASVYEDARILLLPHQMDNRPRVILEAQSNAIPIIAADWPGIAEAVGPGGVLVPPDATTDRWLAELDAIWGDEGRYATLCESSRAHAARAEVQPAFVVAQFEEAVHEVVQRHDCTGARR